MNERAYQENTSREAHVEWARWLYVAATENIRTGDLKQAVVLLDRYAEFAAKIRNWGRWDENRHLGRTAEGHEKYCDAKICGGVFQCVGCRKLRGWCCGASDDKPTLCDDCW